MNDSSNVLKIVRVVVCLLVLVISIGVIAPIASSPDTYKETIEKLDEKQKTVTELTAVSTIASIGVGAVPGDATSPVANKIMDLAGWLVLVFSAILMEKYFLTVVGYLAFRWMIPIVCILIGLNTFIKNQFVTKAVVKMLVLVIVLISVVPMSVSVSEKIEETYNLTYEQTSQTANDLADLDSNLKVTDKLKEQVQDGFQNLVDRVVVLIVTNCVIPIFVFVFLFWIINMVLGIQINLPDLRKLRRKV